MLLSKTDISYSFLSKSTHSLLHQLTVWYFELYFVMNLALLLLYDVTNKTSFDNIRAWLVEIREYAQDDVVILLLGKYSIALMW